jgi:branched-chain amino acid transport system ATP-binding protein
MSLLEIEHLELRHGLLVAVRDFSLSISQGETIALVGANGAGKTTLLRAIAGAHRPSSGTITYDGANITRLAAYRRVRNGIALVPEGRRLFPGLTVEENLLVAAQPNRLGRWTVETVIEAFPMLARVRHQRASTLSGGEQQATAIGRALISNPRLLLLDEVSLGLSPRAIDDVYGSLATVIQEGATILLVEQDLSRATAVAHRVVCMLEGRLVLEGASRQFTREQITDAYFGLRRTMDVDA